MEGSPQHSSNGGVLNLCCCLQSTNDDYIWAYEALSTDDLEMMMPNRVKLSKSNCTTSITNFCRTELVLRPSACTSPEYCHAILFCLYID